MLGYFTPNMDERLRVEIKEIFLGYSLDRAEFFNPKGFIKRYPTCINNAYELMGLVSEIVEFESQLASRLNGNGQEIFLLIPELYAKVFLNHGGFSKIYESEEKEWERLFSNILELKFLKK